MDKIGIIGLGHMGQAMINGFQKKHLTNNLIGYHYDAKILKELTKKLTIELTNDYQEFVQKTTFIILAIRPGDVDAVIEKLNRFDLKKKVIISIVSGLTINQLETKIKQKVGIVRALPNLNTQVGLSATGVAFNQLISAHQKELVINYLNSFGKTYEISEKEFSAFTVVAGCTPAYFFKIVDAIYQSGIKNGLNQKLALEVALQSGYGSLTTLLNSELTPKQLVDAVCVPNGITIEGINYLDEKQFDQMINQAIIKSIKKDLKGH